MHKYLSLVLLLSVPLFSQEPATVEQEIRSAMAHSVFRSQPITIEAAISAGGKQIGGYRLIWNSNADWADRVDIQDHTSLTIAKGDHQYRKRNTAADHPWVRLIEVGFDPEQRWRDGSERRFIKSVKMKSDRPLECGEFEAKPKDRLIACISATDKELISLSTPKIIYSDFIEWRGARYPRHFNVRDAEGGSPEFTLDIGRIGVNGKVPEPEPGMEESFNCAPAALKGGRLKSSAAPDYPAPARLGRIQGAVSLFGEIKPDGTVEIKSVSGHPMLAPSAKSAVSGWKYTPFTCNGTPIAVPTVITVNFTPANF